MIGIYKIINKLNGKIYIGQSIHIEIRIRDHFHRALNKTSSGEYDCPFHRAIRKYGRDSFEWEVLEECSKEDLDKKEDYWIRFYNSKVPNGYNLSYGGESHHKYLDRTLAKKLMEQKYSNKEIAKALGCHPSTITTLRKELGFSLSRGHSAK